MLHFLQEKLKMKQIQNDVVSQRIVLYNTITKLAIETPFLNYTNIIWLKQQSNGAKLMQHAVTDKYAYSYPLSAQMLANVTAG